MERQAGEPQARPVRIKADRVVKAVSYLASLDRAATARELSQVMGVEPRLVYTYLRHAIAAGLVRVTKAGRYNLYHIPKGLRAFAMRLLSTYRKAEDVVRLALEARGIKADPHDVRLLVELARRLAARRGWVGGRADDFAEELAAALRSSASDVAAGLRALAEKGVVLLFERVRGVAKVRLADGWAHLIHVV